MYLDINFSNFHDQKHLLAFEKHWLNGKDDDNHSFDDNNAFDDDGNAFDDDGHSFDGDNHAFDGSDHSFGDAHGLRWWRCPPLQERPVESRHYSDINQVAPQVLHDNDDNVNRDDHHHNYKT